VGTKYSDCRGIEADGAPAASGFGLGHLHLPPDNHSGPSNRRLAAFEVDVGPSQAGYLAATQPDGKKHHPHPVQTLALNDPQEPAGVLSRPDPHLG